MKQRPSLRSIITTVAVVLALSACNGSITFGDGIRGSGELVTTQFEVDDFDSIEVSSTFNAFVVVGEQPFVEIVANENLVDELDIRVRRGTLLVGVRDNVSINSGTLEATIRVPELVALDISGASEVTLEGSSGADQRFEISGASELEATGFRGALVLDVSGSSDVVMDGVATELTLVSGGASDLTLNLLDIEKATVDLSGASSVELESAEFVTGRLSGASDLTVPAGAEVSVDLSGASDVRRS